MSSLRQVGHTLDASNCSQSPPSGLPDRSTPHLSSLTRSAISTSTLCLPGCCAPVYLATPPPPAPMWKTQRATCVCVCAAWHILRINRTFLYLGASWTGGGTCIFFQLRLTANARTTSSSVFSGVVQLFTLQHLTARFFLPPAMALGNGQRYCKVPRLTCSYGNLPPRCLLVYAIIPCRLLSTVRPSKYCCPRFPMLRTNSCRIVYCVPVIPPGVMQYCLPSNK